MIIAYIAVCAVLAGIAAHQIYRMKENREISATSNADFFGVTTDEEGNIALAETYDAMRSLEENHGDALSEKQAGFVKLIRLVSEGPTSVEDIRFLLQKGLEPVVRPDGLVYVPCDENEHLSMTGEIPLEEEDLDNMSNIKRLVA